MSGLRKRSENAVLATHDVRPVDEESLPMEKELGPPDGLLCNRHSEVPDGHVRSRMALGRESQEIQQILDGKIHSDVDVSPAGAYLLHRYKNFGDLKDLRSHQLEQEATPHPYGETGASKEYIHTNRKLVETVANEVRKQLASRTLIQEPSQWARPRAQLPQSNNYMPEGDQAQASAALAGHLDNLRSINQALDQLPRQVVQV